MGNRSLCRAGLSLYYRGSALEVGDMEEGGSILLVINGRASEDIILSIYTPASTVSIVTRQQAIFPTDSKVVRPKLYFCCTVSERDDPPHPN